MGQVYFLSDIHLKAPDDERTRRVIRFLRSLQGRADAVYLVGDLFDFWLGYSSVIYSAYFPVLRCLADLVESGTQVVICPGNHDPDPGPFLIRELGAEVRERPFELTLGDHRVWLEHGDAADRRGLFQRAACHLVHVPWLRCVARSIHPDIMWRAVALYAETMESLKKPSAGLPETLINDYFIARAAAGFDVVIMGHYHRALMHVQEVEGRRCTLFVLGDWLRLNTYVRYYDGRFELLRDRGPDQPAERLGLGDHPPRVGGA